MTLTAMVSMKRVALQIETYRVSIASKTPKSNRQFSWINFLFPQVGTFVVNNGKRLK